MKTGGYHLIFTEMVSQFHGFTVRHMCKLWRYRSQFHCLWNNQKRIYYSCGKFTFENFTVSRENVMLDRGEILQQNSVCVFRVDALKYLFHFFQFSVKKNFTCKQIQIYTSRKAADKLLWDFNRLTSKIRKLAFTIEFIRQPEGFILDKCTSCLLASNWFKNNRIQLV